MSYTDETLANAAYELMRLRGLQVEPSIIPRLAASIRPALERLAVRVATAAPKVRELMRRTFDDEVAVASGSGDLSALLEDDRPLLLSAIRTADIRDEDGAKVQMLADRASLEQTGPTAFIFGAAQGETFYTTGSNGDYTVTANFIETDLSQLSRELEPWLFEELLGAPKAEAA